MQPTIAPDDAAAFIADMAARMADLARQLSGWAAEAPRTLAEMEERAMGIAKDLGAALVGGVCQLAASPAPARRAACACGRPAPYQRRQPAQVLTVLGAIRVRRPVYWCRACHCSF